MLGFVALERAGVQYSAPAHGSSVQASGGRAFAPGNALKEKKERRERRPFPPDDQLKGR
jgi:hypothetical protein